MRIGSASLGAGQENAEIARSLLAGRGFANPFAAGVTGPTAHAAPVYPALLYLQLRIFGDSPAFGIAATLLDIVLQTIALLLLPRLSDRLFGSAGPGYAAAGLMLLVNYPMPQTETALAALLCILIVMAADARTAGPTAVLTGIAALTNPAVCPAAGLAMLRKFRWRRTLWIAAGAAAIALPWVLRTRAVLGAWEPVRDNFGLELWVSNGDGAAPGMFEGRRFRATHPMHSTETAARMRQEGEADFNRGAMRQAARWAEGHPAEFLRLTAARIWLYWFPEPFPAIWAMTILSAVGIWLAPRGAVLLLLPFLAIYPLPYYLIQATARYRLPALWVSALLAGYALDRAWAAAAKSLRRKA